MADLLGVCRSAPLRRSEVAWAQDKTDTIFSFFVAAESTSPLIGATSCRLTSRACCRTLPAVKETSPRRHFSSNTRLASDRSPASVIWVTPSGFGLECDRQCDQTP